MRRIKGIGYVKVMLQQEKNGVMEVVEEEFRDVPLVIEDRRNPLSDNRGVPMTDGCLEVRIGPSED